MKKNILRRCTDKIYGGLNMSWPVTVLYAVAAALLTSIFLFMPVFKDTSFARMGVTFEAWIFFAVIIMANCRTPLESALKTFVFFLISQPLIYLIQIPFTVLGWRIFMYYRYWFIWTLLTLPMAYIGWYITKKNWLSLLILATVLCYLTWLYVDGFRTAYSHFPRMLVMALFCLLQVLIYLYVFTEKTVQKLIGLLAPLAVMFALTLITPEADINTTQFLPGDPVLSEEASVTVDDPEITVQVEKTGEDSMIGIQARKFGTTAFTITDGGNDYHYSLEIFEDSEGHTQINIAPVE
jgi:hypothetical protein